MKTTIKNRHGLKIVTLLEKADQPQGLAIILHGLGGFKDQDHIEVFAQSFKDANYTVLRYDATHSFGESEGEYKEATTSGYYDDLEDVIDWAKDQDWYIEPFVLVGHSLGGISILLYAEKYPDKVKALVPISTVVSGELMKQVYGDQLKTWQEKGFIERPSVSKSGTIEILNWSFVEDIKDIDTLPEADKLTMPVLLIVGDNDKYAPHQDILYEKLPDEKELHIIKGAGHTFRDPDYLRQIKQIFDKWIKKL